MKPRFGDYNKTIKNLEEGIDSINNIYYESNKIDLNKCSKDCCNFTEWPISSGITLKWRQ